MTVGQFADLLRASSHRRKKRGEPARLDVLTLEIAGNTAVARVRDDYLGATYLDTLSLVKEEGWRIYNKLYHVEGPAGQLMFGEPVVQIAYFVSDAQRAALRMAERFGAGPFFLVERIELAWAELRGQPGDFLHTSAYGQWGNLMVEFVQQDEEGPSPFRELYAPGEEGIHHTAVMVDSLVQPMHGASSRGCRLRPGPKQKRARSLRSLIRRLSWATSLRSTKEPLRWWVFTSWCAKPRKAGMGVIPFGASFSSGRYEVCRNLVGAWPVHDLKALENALSSE